MSVTTRLRALLSFERLTPRDRRALRIGLILVLPVLLWTFVARPWRAALADTRDQLEVERALLAREQGLLQSADALPAAIRDAETVAERTRRRLVSAANVALIEAEVIDQLEDLAARSRVLLQELRGLQADRRTDPSSVIRPVKLAVQGESDLDGITRLLHGMEESQLLLRIEELSIEPVLERPQTSGRGRSNEPPAQARPTGAVQLTMIVVAYAPPDIPGDTSSAPQEMVP